MISTLKKKCRLAIPLFHWPVLRKHTCHFGKRASMYKEGVTQNRKASLNARFSRVKDVKSTFTYDLLTCMFCIALPIWIITFQSSFLAYVIIVVTDHYQLLSLCAMVVLAQPQLFMRPDLFILLYTPDRRARFTHVWTGFKQGHRVSGASKQARTQDHPE